MHLRHKTTGRLCHSDRLNINSVNEIIVYFEDDCDSDFISNYEVELGIGESTSWKDLAEAFRDRDVITDNYNTRFFEPRSKEDRERGYTLD